MVSLACDAGLQNTVHCGRTHHRKPGSLNSRSFETLLTRCLALKEYDFTGTLNSLFG